MTTTFRNKLAAGGSLLLLMGLTTAASAGSFILAGTDADDHGFADSSGNQEGWLFMQRALESIAPGVTNSNKTVVVLGSSSGTAMNAANSAFSLSSLPGAGWSVSFIDGAANLTNFFSGGGINGAGILLMDSGDNVSGGADFDEVGVFTTYATTIDSFLGSGGGLFSQSNGFGWISALVPGLVAVDNSEQGLALTAAGNAAFPGLTNADLSSGPWHNSFANIGTLPILAVGLGQDSPAVILGAQGGSVTVPVNRVPDTGSTLALMLGSMGTLLGGRLLKKRNARA
jgi:hypothetical protein